MRDKVHNSKMIVGCFAFADDDRLLNARIYIGIRYHLDVVISQRVMKKPTEGEFDH
jgi:hypothetical protein